MNKTNLKLALVGATGLVGRTILRVLEERGVALGELYPIASPKSKDSTISFGEKEWVVTTLEDGKWREADVALLSAGVRISQEWVPKLADTGITCIDNSSAFRQKDGVPLVVPEVNPEAIQRGDHIIANPNCSTIQLVVVLNPLHRAFGLQEVIVSTYQSASGAGQRGKLRLESQRAGDSSSLDPFTQVLFDNLIPRIGPLDPSGYFSEEWKLVQESRKILSAPDLKVFPTAARIPIPHCHGEAVHLRFKNTVNPTKARKILTESPGVEVWDDPENDRYPTPVECHGSDSVFVGRIRQMTGESETLDLWIVTDNLRKGAATNAVQILELMVVKNLLR